MKSIPYDKKVHEKIVKELSETIRESADFKVFFPNIIKVVDEWDFFLVYDEEFVGFYFITNDSFGMYVLPQHRRKGHGGKILDEIKDKMKDRSVIYANVVEGNDAALNLYSKHHFIVTHHGIVSDKPSIRLSYFPKTTKLNLGCGMEYQKEFLNIDINDKLNPDLVYDLREGIPFEDNKIDEILAKDFLEHLPREKTIFFWNEMYRVCKNNAVINVAVPYAGSDLYYADPEHLTGYRLSTFKELSKPNELMDYKGNMSVIVCGRSEETKNLHVQMVVIK